jgi:Cdc6-like AAA superfamily ATPase
MGYFDGIQGKPVIKDHRALSFTYVPKDLPHREEQMRRMFSIFRSMTRRWSSRW